MHFNLRNLLAAVLLPTCVMVGSSPSRVFAQSPSFSGRTVWTWHDAAGSPLMVSSATKVGGTASFSHGSALLDLGNGDVLEAGVSHGLSIDDAAFSGVIPGGTFTLGTLRLRNGTTFGDSDASSVQLRALLYPASQMPGVLADLSFQLVSTDNSADRMASADIVSIGLPSIVLANRPGHVFRLQLSLVNQDPAAAFLVGHDVHIYEGQTGTVAIIARLTDERVPQDLYVQWTTPPSDTSGAMAEGEGVLVKSVYGRTGFLTPFISTIYRSTNGGAWAPVDSSGTSEMRAAAYGDGKFVLVGANGNFATSEADSGHDLGEVWVKRTYGTRDFSDVIFADGKFRALAGSTLAWRSWELVSKILTSTDGINWQEEGTTAWHATRLLYGNGRYVMIGLVGMGQSADSGSPFYLQSSGDGVNWSLTNVSSVYSQSVKHLVYGNGVFLASLSDSSLLVSPDGVNWTRHRLPPELNPGSELKALSWIDGTFVGCVTGATNPATFRIITSADGVSWVPRPLVAGDAGTKVEGRDHGVLLVSGIGLRQSVPHYAFPPQILRQPASGAARMGERAGLSVSVFGENLSYQWFEGVPGDTSHPLNGLEATVTTPPALPGLWSFWVRVSNPFGTVDSAAATISVREPEIWSGGGVRTGAIGAPGGSQASIYLVQDDFASDAIVQWQRGGVSLPDKRGVELNFAPVKFGDGGDYRAVITTAAGNYVTRAVNLIVLGNLVGPGVTKVGGTAVLTALVQGPSITCEWFVNLPRTYDESFLSRLNDGVRISGSTTPVLTLRNVNLYDQQEYVCVIYSRGEYVAECATRFQLKVQGPPVDLVFNDHGPWSAGQTSLASLGVTGSGVTYAITGLPSGMSFDANNGAIYGRPVATGTYTLRITARNSFGAASMVKVISVAPAPSLMTGTFVGLVDRDLETNRQLGGSFRLVTTSNSLFTGSLTLGASVYRFSGGWEVSEDGSATSHVKLAGKTTETLGFDLSLPVNSQVITGKLWTPTNRLAVDGGVPLRAIRSPWGSGIQAVAHVGLYTAALRLPESLRGVETYPQGTGYLMGTIDRNGIATMAVRLADNTVATISTMIGGDSTLPLHYLLYGGNGSAQGWHLQESGLIDGELTWLKYPESARSTSRSYRSGIPLHTLSTIGSTVIQPSGGALYLGATLSASNATLTFQQGGLLSAMSRDFTILANNNPLLAPGTPYTLAFDKVSGKFTGILTAEGRRAAFYGIFVPRLALGLGHFQMPQSTSSTSAILSGPLEMIVR